jgi:hypothetical protein
MLFNCCLQCLNLLGPPFACNHMCDCHIVTGVRPLSHDHMCEATLQTATLNLETLDGGVGCIGKRVRWQTAHADAVFQNTWALWGSVAVAWLMLIVINARHTALQQDSLADSMPRSPLHYMMDCRALWNTCGQEHRVQHLKVPTCVLVLNQKNLPVSVPDRPGVPAHLNSDLGEPAGRAYMRSTAPIGCSSIHAAPVPCTGSIDSIPAVHSWDRS